MSQHIQQIEITNFKSIRHAKIDGCKRVNVFIGYPNVGKSAILEAISSLSYIQKDYNDDLNRLCRLYYSYELFFNANIKEPIILSFNDSELIKLEYKTEKDLSMNIFSSKGLAEGISNCIKSVGFQHGKRSISQSSFNRWHEYPYSVKKYTFSKNYDNLKTEGTSLKFPFGENLVDVLHTNKNIRKVASELFKLYDLDLSIDLSTNTIKGIKRSDDLPILIPFYQMADTLQRLIFNKAAIMSNKDTVLLFEEPEAHMFPPYIRQFTKDIVFDEGRNNQYFIATHSPLVLSDFLEDVREDLAIHLVGYKNGETTIKTLTNTEVTEVYEYGVDLFFNLESYLA